MLRLVLAALLAVLSLAPLVGTAIAGDTRVRGYTRQDGTYVQPHMRSAPDANRSNNWSTQGNVNPYTGQPGTRSPDSNSALRDAAEHSRHEPVPAVLARSIGAVREQTPPPLVCLEVRQSVHPGFSISRRTTL